MRNVRGDITTACFLMVTLNDTHVINIIYLLLDLTMVFVFQPSCTSLCSYTTKQNPGYSCDSAI